MAALVRRLGAAFAASPDVMDTNNALVNEAQVIRAGLLDAAVRCQLETPAIGMRFQIAANIIARLVGALHRAERLARLPSSGDIRPDLGA